MSSGASAVFSELDGPFVCAVWDERSGSLLLARDRFGIRPLPSPCTTAVRSVFASEIKAVPAGPVDRGKWNPEAIDTYLTLGYIPSPLTIYRDVRKLDRVMSSSHRSQRSHAPVLGPVSRAARRQKRGETYDALKTASRARWRALRKDGAPAGLLQSGGTASTTLLSALRRARSRGVSVAVEQETSSVLAHR